MALTTGNDDGRHRRRRRRRETTTTRIRIRSRRPTDGRTDGPTERLCPIRSVRPVTERLFRVKINQPTDPWRNRIARVASTKTRESDSFDFAGSRGRERAGAFPSSERSSSATRDGARNGSFVRSVARRRAKRDGGGSQRCRTLASRFTLFRARYFHLHFVCLPSSALRDFTVWLT